MHSVDASRDVPLCISVFRRVCSEQRCARCENASAGPERKTGGGSIRLSIRGVIDLVQARQMKERPAIEFTPGACSEVSGSGDWGYLPGPFREAGLLGMFLSDCTT